MASLFIEIPPLGSIYWLDSVATTGALPTGNTVGEARLVQASGLIYWWNGTSWNSTTPSAFVSAVATTNSTTLTVTTGTLTADLKLSAAAADANNLKATYSVKADGLFIELPFATAGQTGVLTSTDWSTFNAKQAAGNYITALTGDVTAAGPGSVAATVVSVGGATSTEIGRLTGVTSNVQTQINGKEPTITSGTTGQYWRGDKSFQNLNTDAITVSAGTAHASGKIGELISSQVTSATTTGVGATGVYGNVTSISLTAGDWLLTGVAGFNENGATLTTSVACGFSTDAAGATLGTLDPAVYNNLISSTSDLVAPVATLNVAITSTTTYYLNTRFFYTAGTPKHYGRIVARRMT